MSTPQDSVPAPDDERDPARLLAENQRLREQAKARVEFLQNLAHELATPLTPLVGYLKLLRSGRLGELSEKQLQVLGAMVNATDRLERSLDSLVDYTALETGQYRIHRTSFDAVQVVEHAVADVAAKARAKHVHVAVTKPAKLEVAGDDSKIRQALAQVLDNAVRFSPHNGHVLVVLSESSDRVAFDVFDQGPGMTPETQKAVFLLKRDERAHGTGLGLPVTRQIVEAHGGQLFFESPPKEQPEVRDLFSGTRVGFWIPQQR